jgi:outer membrane protein assembly factor BamE (lipoprotein component of BamABCDE complex)
MRVKQLLALLLFSTTLALAGCMSHPIHQGNVMKADNVWAIQEGDTRFRVESLLGTPAIKDPLHPNRVHYVEEVDNDDSGEKFTRGVDIEYDNALRVKSIHRYGFKR